MPTLPDAERAVALIRVSRGDASEHSPEVQARGVIAHAEQRTYRLDPGDILDENLDDDTGKVRKVSGGSGLALRPKLAAAVAMIEARTHTVLIAERFDRLFRDIDLQRSVIERIERAGGRIESPVGGALSHATPEAEMHANLDGVVAQYQKRTAKVRSWDAVEVAIEQGHYPGPVPPGLVRAHLRGPLALGPEWEVSAIRAAFDARMNGATIVEVQAVLADHGIKRSQGGVRKILGCKLYVGEIHFGNHTPNLAAVTPIIDPGVWDRVRAMVVPAGRHGKSDRILARMKLVRCETCDGRMSVSHTKRGTYPFYRCTNHDGCTAQAIVGADNLERMVTDAIREHHRTERGRAQAAAKARRAAEAEAKALDDLTSAIDLLKDFSDVPGTRGKLDRLRAAHTAAKAEAARLADAVPAIVTRNIDETLDHGSLEAKRSLIRATVERVSVRPGRGGGRVTVDLI